MSEWMNAAGEVSGEIIAVVGPKCVKFEDHSGRWWVPEGTWPRPIPVSERLPDSSDLVLAFCGVWLTARSMEEYWAPPRGGGRISGVTHWLPLPPKPKQ